MTRLYIGLFADAAPSSQLNQETKDVLDKHNIKIPGRLDKYKLWPVKMVKWNETSHLPLGRRAAFPPCVQHMLSLGHSYICCVLVRGAGGDGVRGMNRVGGMRGAVVVNT